jgi:hypothetical protein
MIGNHIGEGSGKGRETQEMPLILQLDLSTFGGTGTLGY